MQAALKLFQAEKDRYKALLSATKSKIGNIASPPQSAWIQAFPAEFGDPLALGVLHEAHNLTNSVRQLPTQLDQVERNFDLTVEVNGYTKAGVPSFEADELIFLCGALPFPGKNVRKMLSGSLGHDDMDRRLLELSRRLAEAVEHDTSLVGRAKEHVDHLLKKDQGPANRDITEWRDILKSHSTRRLSHFLISSRML